MKKDSAERIAEALQESLGKSWSVYKATYSDQKKTWVITHTIDVFENGNEITGTYDEEELIHYLIGYAKEAMNPTTE